MPRILGPGVGAAMALVSGAADAVGASIPEAGACEPGKTIERALGRNGYRVVVSGGSGASDDGSVKVQVWENDDGDWVITEAFIERNSTCVVRSGSGLHMMY